MKRQDGTLLRSILTLFGEGTTGGLTDAQLLGRFLSQRDETTFEALVFRHGPMVFDVCHNHLSSLPEAESPSPIRDGTIPRGLDCSGNRKAAMGPIL